MFPILLRLGPITLHTYGLMVGLGFLAGYFCLRAEFQRRGLSSAAAERLVPLLMISGIVGARILYFGVDGFRGLREDPLDFFRVWEGGLVFYGGAVAGIIALIAGVRWLKLPFLDTADALAPGLLIAHALGRLGCFAAGCCYGVPTASIFGVTFTNPDSLAPLNIPLHPTQLYEAGGNFVLFLAALALSRLPRRQAGRRPRAGSVTVFYLVSYGLFRFAVEFLRGDDRGVFLGKFSPSQWISIGMVAAGTILAICLLRSHENKIIDNPARHN